MFEDNTDDDGEGEEGITFYDIETMVSIAQPSKAVMLAAAAILILLADGNDVPGDISWGAFCDMASIDDVAWDMNTVVPSSIPRFKVRAIAPFVAHLNAYVNVWKQQQGDSLFVIYSFIHSFIYLFIY